MGSEVDITRPISEKYQESGRKCNIFIMRCHWETFSSILFYKELVLILELKKLLLHLIRHRNLVQWSAVN